MAEELQKLGKNPGPYAAAQNAIVAHTAIGSAYAVAIAQTEGHLIEVKNGTNADIVIKTKNLEDKDVELILPTQDFSVRAIPLIHNGPVSVKHNGSAPTSGNVLLQSICMGN